MSVEIKKEQCCGCFACVPVCPCDAIKAGEDENGFSLPVIDETKCIDCGKCVQICAFKNVDSDAPTVKSAYAFQLSDSGELKKSTSGGAFTALSDIVLEQGGVIAGAVMDGGFRVFHKIADTKPGRDEMRLSKYVQSDTSDIFETVKSGLGSGKKVMFVGTPCQAAQLDRYIGKSDGLLICDFLCHGVPSQSLFYKHISYLEEMYGKKAAAYSFRGKRYGWNHGIDEITFADGTYKDGDKVQCYTKLFQANATLRDSCLECPYRGAHRYSDITIADFWGVENILNITDTKGMSLVLANTEKGEEYIKRISENGSLTQVPVESIMKKLSAAPVKKYQNLEQFRAALKNEGYPAAVKKFVAPSVKSQLRFAFKKKVLGAKQKS